MGMGEVTLRDALVALRRDPSYDPRDDLLGVPGPVLLSVDDAAATGAASAGRVPTLAELEEGMELQGTITNVVDFGAFVDLGIGASGLWHISKWPRGGERAQLTMVGARATFTVTSVEIQDLRAKKARISLELPLSK